MKKEKKEKRAKKEEKKGKKGEKRSKNGKKMRKKVKNDRFYLHNSFCTPKNSGKKLFLRMDT